MRIWVNSLQAGTIEIKNTIPKHKSKRADVCRAFIQDAYSFWERLDIMFCRRCGMRLFNPQSQILHRGKACRKVPNTNSKSSSIGSSDTTT